MSVPSIFRATPTNFPGSVKPKPAQSMSNPERMDMMRQLKQTRTAAIKAASTHTAASHTAMFGSSFMGGAAGSVQPSEYTNPYSHNFPVDILEHPQSRQEQIEWFIRFYREHPLVRRVIDLHTQLPMSKMTITKPASSSPAFSEYVHQFFMDMVTRINLQGKLKSNTAKNYWLQGDDFVFLEDQKEGENDYNDSPYRDVPDEASNPSKTNFFDVHRYLHTSAQKNWDDKYKSLNDNPFIKVIPGFLEQSKLNIPSRPKSASLNENDYLDTFGHTAFAFINTLHTIKNASRELKKFVDVVSGKKSAEIGSLHKALIENLGPEFLSFQHSAAFSKYKQATNTFKVAESKEEDPSDVDMALDPSKRPVFKLLGLDPINVESIPRNDRAVSPTPNLDYQKFLRDNPKLQKAISELPDPNQPVQINNQEGVGVQVYGPDGVSPLTDDDTSTQEGGDDALDLDGMDLVSGDDIGIPDLGTMSPGDDPNYKILLEEYNKNLKKKKDLLESLIEDLRERANDYRCFGNIKFPKYKGWQAIRSLPPNQIEVARQSNSDDIQIFYIPTPQEAAAIQGNFDQLSEEAQEFWKTKKRLLLSTQTSTRASKDDPDLPEDGSYCVQVSNSRSDYELYGHSLVEACLRDLMQDDKIAQVKSQTFARNMQPKRLIVAEGVDDAVLGSLQGMVDASTVDPDVSVIVNYPVDWKEMGAESRLQNFDGEYSHITTNLTAGLAFFQEFITGATTYGGSRTPQEIMNTMYLSFREDIAHFITEHVFRPVAIRKGFYDIDEFGNKVLIYPSVSFSRLAIRDHGETYDMLLNLYMKGSVSVSRIYEIMNIDEEEETQKLRDELFTMKDPKFTDLIANMYQNVAQQLVERTNLAEIIAKNMGLVYTEPKPEEDGSGDDLKL